MFDTRRFQKLHNNQGKYFYLEQDFLARINDIVDLIMWSSIAGTIEVFIYEN